MTYEQSLQNIENIKNFVLPYGNQVVVFDFQSADSFQIIFYSNYTDQLNDKLRADALNRNRPHAFIENDKNDLPILSYIDKNLIVNFNIMLSETIDFHKREPIDKAQLQIELMSLVRHLKNT